MDLSSLIIGVRYTRPDLARRWGYASPKAIQRGVITPKGKYIIVLFVTRVKPEHLPQYHDCISGDLLFWEGETKHGTDERIARAEVAGDVIYLFYREVHRTPFEYRGPVLLVTFKSQMKKPSEFVFRLVHDQGPDDDLARCKADLATIPDSTEREEVRRARLGQGRFRQGLIELWDGRCSITGVAVPPLLTASHVKPWRAATNQERLDPYNGLLLLPQYDRLFDRGLITFDDDGGMILSEAFPAEQWERAGVNPDGHLRFLNGRHRDFLAYHRTKVFADAGRGGDS